MEPRLRSPRCKRGTTDRPVWKTLTAWATPGWREEQEADHRVELIAHRAGNRLDGPDGVRHLADTIELDVRLDRGRIVVRHARRIWLTDRLWERWYLLPPDATAPTFRDAAAAVDGDLGLWIDCKGISPRTPPRTLHQAGPRDRITVSSKAWWALGSVDDREGVRVIRSVSNRFELALLHFLPSRVEIDGVTCHSRLLDRGLVGALKERYGTVFSWFIPDAATGRRLVDWGVQGLIVDDPEVLDELRRLL